MHIRNSNNVNPRFYIVTCHYAGWDLLKAKVLWWILIEASLNIALNHFYTFYPVYLWPSDFISLIYFLRGPQGSCKLKDKNMGFFRFLRLKVSIQEPERSKKGKKTQKKNTVNILMHMKKLSRERVRCEAHQHLYPWAFCHGRKSMIVAIRLSSILSRSTGACTS